MLNNQKWTGYSQSSTNLLPCSHQAHIRMRLDRFALLDDSKSFTSFQQSWCKLIVEPVLSTITPTLSSLIPFYSQLPHSIPSHSVLSTVTPTLSSLTQFYPQLPHPILSLRFIHNYPPLYLLTPFYPQLPHPILSHSVLSTTTPPYPLTHSTSNCLLNEFTARDAPFDVPKYVLIALFTW